ncbi:Hsp20/alpha crystallin family protein [Rubrobacter taiwanensis]|uniref:Hsp20/alpha crystallin family protein n=1 Tax=Rubrobacter taiwanensis TaxID=185139 RepID=A0A4R1BR81_9ACTN|nr:Hsp20/alpha crystallin family protein [Rubrobacter taiwanensis]TCJ20098.1 Hsp20/alpha crystallin family protein [Rubrobacter taiwanensis]
MFNPVRWLVERVREMDRGMAVMRGEEFGSGVELGEEGEEFVIRAGLPGVEPGDVDVALFRRGVIAISGIRRAGREDVPVYDVRDLGYDTFRHTVDLPEGYDESTARAWLREGVLEIRVRRGVPEGDLRRIGLEGFRG